MSSTSILTASAAAHEPANLSQQTLPKSKPKPKPRIDPALTESDLAVIRHLFRDVEIDSESEATGPSASAGSAKLPTQQYDQRATMEALATFKQEPVVFCTWDYSQLPLSRPWIGPALKTYIAWAQRVVRYPGDVVFMTHILLYLSTSVPSAILLYRYFSWTHGIFHFIMQAYFCGAFTLMLHNCIHQNGLLARQYAAVDQLWPYILSPLMGHTWNSYFYHHVKHHHIEGNGPDDLSSTIRYQRDNVFHFFMYVGRFLALVWLELPLYFVRKQRYQLAFKCAFWEFSSYLFIYATAKYHFDATLFVFILPFCLMRIGLMVGNFGQHALVDDVDPKSDFRSSITLIDVPSNRFCFNDGYHTSHHLNPRRHWRDHQLAFIKSKPEYRDGKALVFHNIDYLMMTFQLLRKNYLYLADCMIPIGEQIGMTRQQKADLLRTKTRRFTEQEIQEKFYGKSK